MLWPSATRFRAGEVVRSVLARLHAGASPPALSDVLVQLYGLVTRYAVEPVAATGEKPLLQVLAEIRTVSAADLFLSRLVAAVCEQRRGSSTTPRAGTTDASSSMSTATTRAGDLHGLLASSLRLSPSYVYRILKQREKRPLSS